MSLTPAPPPFQTMRKLAYCGSGGGVDYRVVVLGYGEEEGVEEAAGQHVHLQHPEIQQQVERIVRAEEGFKNNFILKIIQ